MPAKSSISRRQFLHVSAVALSSLCLAACTRLPSAQQDTGQVANYYLANKDKIQKEIDQVAGYLKGACAQKYGEAKATTLVANAQDRFAVLLPSLPFIGGNNNDLTQNLSLGAMALAFYRAMQDYKLSLEETGEILYRTVEAQASADPMSRVGGRLVMSKMAQAKFKDEALKSQQRQYPQDWVFEFVAGDGQSFDYGIDYTECGICKYFQGQQASELVPYLCLLDFPFSAAMNTGLVRSTTLGHGGPRCDFRYKAGRPCQMEWTPPFLAGS